MNNKIDKDGKPIVKEAKNWPEGIQIVNFSDIVSPIREALQIALDKKEKVYNEGIEWTGLKQGRESNIFHPPRALHAVGLKYCKESQGRDVFTELLSIAVQLGMEQGRREIKNNLKEISFMLTSPEGKNILKQIIER